MVQHPRDVNVKLNPFGYGSQSVCPFLDVQSCAGRVLFKISMNKIVFVSFDQKKFVLFLFVGWLRFSLLKSNQILPDQ